MGAMMNECKDCGKDRPLTAYADSVMDFVHGNYVKLCSRCVIVRQLDDARKSAERIPELEAKLEAEGY